jgi:hypothetical protein
MRLGAVMTLAIIIGYAVLSLLTLLALLYSRWPNWLKGFLIVAVTALYFVGYAALHELLGLPSIDPLPERFVMLSAAVEEPTTRSAGAIWIWVSPLIEGKSGLEPRAYRLPYDKSLHQEVDAGLKRAREGSNQMGTAAPRRSDAGALAWLKLGSEAQEIRIRDLPARQLPEK